MIVSKRVLRILLVVLSCMLILQGCGKSSASTSNTAAASAAVTQAAPSNTAAASASTSVASTNDKAEAPSSWKTVIDTKIGHAAYYAGFSNESYGYTVGYGGEIHYTNDGGKSWPQSTNNSMCRFGLDIVDKDTAWNCGNGGNVRVTNDAGKTWVEAADFGDSEPDQCRYISFADKNNGWIAAPQRFAMTSDGAKTWKEAKLPDGVKNIAAVFLRTAKDGYLLDAGGILFITGDGGKTWSKQDLGFQKLNITDPLTKHNELLIDLAPVAAISFTDENNGTVAINGYIVKGVKTWVMKTSDGGKTWTTEEIKLGSDMKAVSLFLSKDGKFLTAKNSSGKLAVLKSN